MSNDEAMINGCDDDELRLIARVNPGRLGILAANELRRRRSAQRPKESDKECGIGSS